MIYLARFFLWLLSLMPGGMPFWLAKKGAGLVMRLSPVKRHTTERNLERCFPDMDPGERERMVRESFEHYLCSILETGHNWYWPTEKLLSRCVEFANPDLIYEWRASGKALIAIAPHFGAWEFLGMYMQGFEDIAILYKPPSNRDLEEALVSRRRRGGATLIPANFSGLVKLYAHLKEGKGVGILPDQQPAPSQGEFVSFFGNQALTGYLVPRLVKRVDCIVLATVCERLDRGYYRVHALPVDDGIFSDDMAVALESMNRAIEDCVAIDPPQYLWSYRRFKAQPEGAEPFYDPR